MTLEQDLYQIAFSALSKLELPNFSTHDQQLIFDTFRKLYGTEFQINEEKAKFICDEVHRLSSETVSMRQVELDSGINGPNAQFILSDGKQEQKIYFGPYSTPFGLF